MSQLTVGVIGHVDHGKTALVRALTGTDTDRLPEEKRRGISIALGFAHLEVAGRTIDLIDMPGHERFVRTMISGATGIGAVLLVVAANEGIKPQTREHVDIAALLGLRRGLVAVTKADLVDAAAAARVAQEAHSLLTRAGLASLPPAVTEALSGRGIPELLAALAGLQADEAPSDGVPFLPIDRAFSVAGHGTVVTGTLRGGPLGPGDALELLPVRRALRVRALQVHGARVTSARPGQRVAVNLRQIQPDQIERGAALAAAGALAPSSWLTVQLRAVDAAPPLPTSAPVQVLVGTAELSARLRLLDRDVLEAGETALAQLRLSAPLAVPVREHVIVRLASPALTVAGGSILDAETSRLRRETASVLERLRTLAGMPPDQIVRQVVEQAGIAGVRLPTLSRLSALAPAKVASVLLEHEVLVTRRELAITQSALDALTERALAALRGQALSREALLAALPGAGAEALEEAIARLLASGAIRQAGTVLAVPRPAAEQARAEAERQQTAALAETLRRGGLTPPDPGAIAPQLITRLVRDGTLIRARDSGQKRDILFHRDAIQSAQRALSPLLAQPPGLLVREIGSALGISRRYSVPLLEHLDSVGFTRRIGDRRILARSD